MSQELKTISASYERDDMTVFINKIIDKEYGMVAGEVIVRRFLGGNNRLPHDTNIWLDDIKQIVTLRDALTSYIEETGLEKKGGQQ